MSRIRATVLLLTVVAGCQRTDQPAPRPAKTQLRALFMKQASYSEAQVREMTDQFEATHPNVEVEPVFVAYESLHEKIVTSAISGAGTYDVVLVDCIWPAEFATRGFLLDVTDRISAEDRGDIYPAALQAVEHQGRLYGMPWINDCCYLFYNKKMLADAGIKDPPKTWDELRTQCRTLRKKDICEYPLAAQWGQSEVLLCDFVAYVHGLGSRILNSDGTPALTSEGTVAALACMKGLLDLKLANPASLEFRSEEVQREFCAGKCAFGVDWIYVFALANDPKQSAIAGNAGITLIPGSDNVRSATPNGGMGLGVMSTCKHPDEAWQYIEHVASRASQRKHAQLSLPIWKSLYDEPELVKAQPVLLKVAKEQYSFMVNRPRLPYYSEASTILCEEIHFALTGKKTPEEAMADAEQRVLKAHKMWTEASR